MKKKKDTLDDIAKSNAAWLKRDYKKDQEMQSERNRKLNVWGLNGVDEIKPIHGLLRFKTVRDNR